MYFIIDLVHGTADLLNLDIPAFDLLEKFDAEDLSAAAAQFDGALSLYAKEYEKAGLKPNVFDSIEAFEKMYLG